MRIAVVASVLVLAACGSGVAAGPSPSPTSPPVTFTPRVEPSPAPAQSQEQPLPAPIEEAAAAVAGGILYVMGGFNAAGASLDGVYEFDGRSWRAGPRLPVPLDHPSAATLDGRLYIAGGHTNGRDSAQLFRFDGDRWTTLAAMHFARGGHALVAAQARLFAIGGNTSVAEVAPAESYDPASNSWSVLPPLPAARNHVMGFVLGQRVCVAGGRYPTTSRVDCFDTAANAWTRLPDLPAATSGGGAGTFPGGDVVVVGGQDASETRIVPQLDRSVAGTGWTAGESMLVPRHGFELALFEGRMWACGGGVAPGLHPVATCTSIGDTAATTRGR